MPPLTNVGVLLVLIGAAALILQLIRIYTIGNLMIRFKLPEDKVQAWIYDEARKDRFKQYVEYLVKLFKH